MAAAVRRHAASRSQAEAAAEAEYERVWAEDAAAMYAYAAASADAAAMIPFTSPSGVQAPNAWSTKSAPDVVATGQQVMTTIPQALRALSLSPTATLDACLAPVTAPLSRLSSLSAPSGPAISRLNSLNKAAALRWLLPHLSGAPITAGLGRATSMGILAVPLAWGTATAPTPAVRAG